MFITSLALADLTMLVSVSPFALINDVTGFWYFGEQYCNIWISIDIMSCTSSILHLCAISLDRYIRIKNPFEYTSIMTNRRVMVVIMLIWLVSGLLSFVQVQHLAQNKEGECMIKMSPHYAIFSSLITFYFPSIIMIMMYAKLYSYVKQHKTRLRRVSSVIELGGFNGEPALTPAPGLPINDHQAAYIVGVVMGTFIICWLPFFILITMVSLCPTCVNSTLYRVCMCFCQFSILP